MPVKTNRPELEYPLILGTCCELPRVGVRAPCLAILAPTLGDRAGLDIFNDFYIVFYNFLNKCFPQQNAKLLFNTVVVYSADDNALMSLLRGKC